MKGRIWNLSYADAPWFDQPDALSRIEARARTPEEASLLRKWVADGYFVLPKLVGDGPLDGMARDLESLWTTDTGIPGLKIEEIRVRPADPPGLRHEDLVKLPASERERLKTTQRWRVHDFPRFSRFAREIFNSPALVNVATLLFGRPCRSENTINFLYGTEQELHQDMAVFSIAPLNWLIGAWVACEDISAESGPLVYYPGSHKERMYEGFDNYPQTHVKTATDEQLVGYAEYLRNVVSRYERRSFLAKKGDVLFWHGMVVHGGELIAERGRTRKSFVCHYIPPGVSVEDQIEGPFRW